MAILDQFGRQISYKAARAAQDTRYRPYEPVEKKDISDLVPALQRGTAAGGAAGLLAGVAAVTFPPAGLTLGGGALLGLTAFGAGFGAWMSSMVGIGLPSRSAAARRPVRRPSAALST
jgi:hypothetical protein